MPGAGNPQAFNRYSYVFNNPLRFVDPSGHLPMLTPGAGGGRAPFVRVSGYERGLFGARYRAYTFDTHRVMTWNNVTNGSRLLWNASPFGRLNADVNAVVAAWEAWGERNLQRMPQSVQDAAQLMEDPLFQMVLMGTIQGPSSANQLLLRSAGGTGRYYNRLTGQGVYVLVDETGSVRYVGRGDVRARLADHARDPVRGQFRAKIVANNNLSYTEARGLEQLLIDHFGGPSSDQLLNHINGISRFNPLRTSYLNAGRELLRDALDIIAQ